MENKNIEQPINSENKEQKKFEFKDLQSMEEYLTWKQSVPKEFRDIVERAVQARSVHVLPGGEGLVNQFFNGFTDKLDNPEAELTGYDARVVNLLSYLTKIGTKEGYINAFDLFKDPNISWSFKSSLYQFQVAPSLEWLVSKDTEELAEQVEEFVKDDLNGISGDDESESDLSNEDSISSMEAGAEKKEGKSKPHFRVKKFFGGYYPRFVKDEFDIKTLKWKKPENEFADPRPENIDKLGKRIIFGNIKGGKEIAIPLPDGWSYEINSIDIDAPINLVEMTENQDGILYLKVNKKGHFKYKIIIGPKKRIAEGGGQIPEKIKIKGSLPKELKDKISEFKQENIQPMALAREITRHIRDNLNYLTGLEGQKVFRKYKAGGDNFFEKIWEIKSADCHVANTLAARALFEAGINPRFIEGYSVNEKDDNGNAVMHSGNGHAWLRVWDRIGKKWLRLDATPKGDPNVNEDQQEKDLSDSGEGDYGEDELMSEEDLKKQIQDMKNKSGGGGKKKRKISDSDIEEENFAELAGCTSEQAREFLQALERVRQIKNENGQSIVELLKEQWRKIVEDYRVEVSEYKGPVRMDEGDSLEDPVDAKIDIKSGEFNPTGFGKIVNLEKIESDFGGINLYFSFDLSGSMAWADAVSGRPKADVQRDAALLFIDALMQCAFISRQEVRPDSSLPIKIMVTLASDTGDVKLHLTDRWGPKEQWAFYSALTQLAKGVTPTHKTLEKIDIDFDKELNELNKKNIPEDKKPLHYTIEVSDGVPDDEDEAKAMHEKLKKKGMSVRSYIIGGEPYCEDSAPALESFSQLPQILSEDIINLFQKLKPRKIKQ